MELGGIHLWLTRPDRADDPALLKAYRDLLSPTERDRLDAIRLEPRRREYLLTRALVRTVMSRYGPVPPSQWRFAQGPHGRPELDPPAGLHFNLSNSPGLVGCAVSRGAVGLDLEPMTRAGQILRLAARVLSSEERRALDALPAEARADRALSLWTLKEAYLKARGLGISVPLGDISFSLDAPSRVGLALRPSLADDPSRWRLALRDHAGHRLALCADTPLQIAAWETTPLLPGSDRPLPLAG